MNATTLPAEIVAFAAAVRAALADLPADEVEELTDGLEADLAEAYAEDLARELPDPTAYAHELRGAAGLPTPQAPKGRLHAIGTSFAEAGRDVERSLRRSPAVSSTLDFLVTLRPAWWIVRGWVAYQVFCLTILGMWKTDVLPGDFAKWLLLILLVAGSVFLGLRSWPRPVAVLIVLGNAFAAFALIPVLANDATGAELEMAYENPPEYEYGSGYEGGDGTGVWLNGSEVTNIFAYNARGERLNGVQLFDQDGKPLTTSVPGGNGCLEKDEFDECAKPGAWMPVQLETGASAWNVFPMKMAESSFDDPTRPVAGAVAQDRPAPFLKVPALLVASPTADAKDSAAATEEKDGKKKP